MPQQELDLFQVAASLATELRTGTPEVVSTEALDPDLLCRFGDHDPDRPVRQALADFASLVEGAEQRAFLDLRGGLPGVDALLDPHRDGNGTDASALAAEVSDHPAVLPHLDVLDT